MFFFFLSRRKLDSKPLSVRILQNTSNIYAVSARLFLSDEVTQKTWNMKCTWRVHLYLWEFLWLLTASFLHLLGQQQNARCPALWTNKTHCQERSLWNIKSTPTVKSPISSRTKLPKWLVYLYSCLKTKRNLVWLSFSTFTLQPCTYRVTQRTAYTNELRWLSNRGI